MTTKTKARATAKKLTTIKLDVGNVRNKTKEIEIKLGTTVAEALTGAGFSIPKDKTPEQDHWWLNGEPVSRWTEKISKRKKKQTLWQLPPVNGGF